MERWAVGFGRFRCLLYWRFLRGVWDLVVLNKYAVLRLRIEQQLFLCSRVDGCKLGDLARESQAPRPRVRFVISLTPGASESVQGKLGHVRCCSLR